MPAGMDEEVPLVAVARRERRPAEVGGGAKPPFVAAKMLISWSVRMLPLEQGTGGGGA